MIGFWGFRETIRDHLCNDSDSNYPNRLCIRGSFNLVDFVLEAHQLKEPKQTHSRPIRKKKNFLNQSDPPKVPVWPRVDSWLRHKPVPTFSFFLILFFLSFFFFLSSSFARSFLCVLPAFYFFFHSSFLSPCSFTSFSLSNSPFPSSSSLHLFPSIFHSSSIIILFIFFASFFIFLLIFLRSCGHRERTRRFLPVVKKKSS